MTNEQPSKTHQKNQKVMSLREQQLSLTRSRIITALAELIEIRHPMEVTMAAVAAKAGVSEPTLYRHFPSKKKLFAALGAELYNKAALEAPPADLSELINFLPSLYDFNAKNEAVARWNLTAPKEDAIRPSAEQRLPLLRSVLSRELGALSEEEGEHLLRAMLLLTSPMCHLYWQDYLGLSAEQSAETAAWMTRQFGSK